MNRYICLIFVFFLGVSCRDFLEEQSQDLAYVTSINDLDELLVGSCYPDLGTGTEENAYSIALQNNDYGYYLHAMDDDTDAYAARYDNNSTFWRVAGFHWWQQDPFYTRDQEIKDLAWKTYYKHIAVLNALLVNVEEFQEESSYERVKGEAHFLRAYYYFMLVNMYAKPYSKATASVDLGVPLKTTEYVEGVKFGRASVEEVYALVVNDLKEAIVNLTGVEQKSVRRASVFAANTLLSRVYLYMGEWELAEKQCDEVLTKGAFKLEDYNGLAHAWCGLKSTFDQLLRMGYTEEMALKYLQMAAIPVDLTQTAAGVIRTTSSETIFAQGLNRLYTYVMVPNTSLGGVPGGVPRGMAMSYKVSDELRNSYEEGDQRAKLYLPGDQLAMFWISSKYGDFYEQVGMNNDITSDIGTIRLAEVYLNKAEALAMQDRDEEAAAVLKELRDKRFITGTNHEITETGKELIDKIRWERRWELCFEGHRWFDLRRYAVSPKYADSKEIRHACYENGGNNTAVLAGYYVLGTYDVDAEAYVLPIPKYAMEYNDGVMVDNVRKPRNLSE